MKKLFFVFAAFLFAATLSAQSAHNMLVKVSDDDSGTCGGNGGKKIEIIIDTNDNGQIDPTDDIDDTQIVCNGEDGTATAVSVTQGAEACGEVGGVTVTVGASQLPVCNGADGADALVRTSSFEGNDCNDCGCNNGGIKIEAGNDNKTKNGTLEDNEVTVTEYVCRGADGASGSNGKNALVKVTTEPKKSDNCPDSSEDGVKIEIGIDSDGDGELDEDEIDHTKTKYVCGGPKGAAGGSGTPGPSGYDALSRTSDEPAGENCKNGGIKIEVGNDKNRDHVLNDDEVIAEQTRYVCNGESGDKGDTGLNGEQGDKGDPGDAGENGRDGASSLVSVVDEPKGENCVSGGKKISVGLDSNRNGVLDEDETSADNTYYICNGSDAEEGGLTSSSTGCSLDTVEENSSLIPALFAVFAAICALFGLEIVRR